jgi:hypothetical protein
VLQRKESQAHNSQDARVPAGLLPLLPAAAPESNHKEKILKS